MSSLSSYNTPISPDLAQLDEIIDIRKANELAAFLSCVFHLHLAGKLETNIASGLAIGKGFIARVARAKYKL